MKHTISLIVLLNSMLLFGQTPHNDPHWQLVWEDNFDSLDLDIWEVKDNFDHYGGLQVFRTNNVYTESGSLVIEFKNELYSCPAWAIDPNWFCVRQYNYGLPYSFTSGQVHSKAPYNTQYGYIEARIKFPHGYALWPAFWTYKGDGLASTTNHAEIDIAEMVGMLGPEIIHTNLHKHYPDDHAMNIKPHMGYHWEDWHTYGIEWSPSKLIWYLDGVPIRFFPNHGVVDPVRIIMGVGLFPDLDISSMTFPYKMRTDFVRVYELKKDCSTTLNLCNYSFPTYDNLVKKEIIIGDGTCTNTIYPWENILMRASEGITINGDFTVQPGGQLYFDASTCD